MSLQTNDHIRVVAVTGASGYVGANVLRILEEEKVDRILALDIRPLQYPLHNAVFLNRSVTQPLGDILREHRVDTVIHLAFVMRPGRTSSDIQRAEQINIGGTENVLRACRAARVRHLVYLSSHTVYGAHWHNPIPITEEAPLRPNVGFQYAEHKVACEEMIGRFIKEYEGLRVTVLRSCVVMGPSAQNYVTQALDKPLLVGVLGANPPMQFVHETDISRLIALMARNPHPGVYNVAGERVIHWHRLVRLANKPMIALPAPFLYPITQTAWDIGLQNDSPAVGLNFIRHPLIVSTGKLKAVTGFRFQYTSEDAFRAYAGNRR
jgi:UDP-glucose 4-epimerase